MQASGTTILGNETSRSKGDTCAAYQLHQGWWSDKHPCYRMVHCVLLNRVHMTELISSGRTHGKGGNRSPRLPSQCMSASPSAQCSAELTRAMLSIAGWAALSLLGSAASATPSGPTEENPFWEPVEAEYYGLADGVFEPKRYTNLSAADFMRLGSSGVPLVVSDGCSDCAMKSWNCEPGSSCDTQLPFASGYAMMKSYINGVQS
eukprot:4527987-Amphidinium_carterae.1